ncbi:22577_t:CDS:2, partial [Gigaspora rosea]
TKFTASIQNYQDDKIKIEISVNEEIRNGSHNNGIENEIIVRQLTQINPVKIYDNPEENIIEMRSAFDDDSVKFIPQEIIEIPCEMFDIIENAGNSKIY